MPKLAIQYDFTERLEFSEGVNKRKDISSILLQNLSGAVSISKSNHTEDRNGTDYFVEMDSGKRLSVDVKIREKDFSTINPAWDDLALETFSVIEKEVVGWTRNSQKQTDYILWLWQDTGRWCLIPFIMLCNIFSENWESWKMRYKTKQQLTTFNGRKYHSECVFVPRKLVWAKMYQKYGGNVGNN